ncbi:18481_t:CDS:2, partial [Gigaspora margarita]
TTTPETRATALVPRKCRMFDIIRKDSGKKMKKVHNTRSKDRETIALLQMTMPEEKEAETTPSLAISRAMAIELQRQHEVDDSLMKNSTVFDMEEFKELKNKQVIREEALEDAQTTVIERVENPYIDKTVVVDQDVNIERETTLSGPEEIQSNTYIEKAVTSSNVEPSDTLTKNLNEGNIALVTLVVNREESNQKNDNRSYDRHTLMNNGTEDTMQPMEDNRFIEVIYTELMEGFTDTACVSKKKPFITYNQTVRNRHSMATRLDYIFLNNDHIWMCKKSETKFGNSDQLHVWYSLYQNQETPKATLWKLNSHMLNNPFISKEIVADLRDKEATLDWDYYK